MILLLVTEFDEYNSGQAMFVPEFIQIRSEVFILTIYFTFYFNVFDLSRPIMKFSATSCQPRRSCFTHCVTEWHFSHG